MYYPARSLQVRAQPAQSRPVAVIAAAKHPGSEKTGNQVQANNHQRNNERLEIRGNANSLPKVK
jgi:hypothetical protein